MCPLVNICAPGNPGIMTDVNASQNMKSIITIIGPSALAKLPQSIVMDINSSFRSKYTFSPHRFVITCGSIVTTTLDLEQWAPELNHISWVWLTCEQYLHAMDMRLAPLDTTKMEVYKESTPSKCLKQVPKRDSHTQKANVTWLVRYQHQRERGGWTNTRTHTVH